MKTQTQTQTQDTSKAQTQDKAQTPTVEETCTLEQAAEAIDAATLPTAHVKLSLVQKLVPRAQGSAIMALVRDRQKARKAPKAS